MARGDTEASIDFNSSGPDDSHSISDMRTSASAFVPNLRPRVLRQTSGFSADGNGTGTWSAEYDVATILPWINVFMDRLHLTIPVMNKFTVIRDLMLNRHKTDNDFGCMILSLCALALVQPVLKQEYHSMSERKELAIKMLHAVTRMRSVSFGENVTVEAAITSFLMFATFFGIGFQDAAWLRLREAVECGKLLNLHDPIAYQDLNVQTKGQHLRLFLILSVTERYCTLFKLSWIRSLTMNRGYALQRNHTISFTGQTMQRMVDVFRDVASQTTFTSSNIPIYDDRDTLAMQGLLQLMRLFDSVDEAVIPCWNRSCAPPMQSCERLTIHRVALVHHAIANAFSPVDSSIEQQTAATPASPWSRTVDQPMSSLLDVQWADCFVLQQWLLTRLWVSCLTHDLLDENLPEHFMKPTFAVSTAENTLARCSNLGSAVLEVHGNGMVSGI